MLASEKASIYKLLRVSSSVIYGYVPSVFSAEQPQFACDALPAASSVAQVGMQESTSNATISSLDSRRGTQQDISAQVSRQVAPALMLSMTAIAQNIADCTRCALCKGRTHTVTGTGVEHPSVLIVGEGPGHDEDILGLPFVGPAGQLLDKMLASISLDRHINCFIVNVVKCRPPHNRTPTMEEAASCMPFLDAQLNILQPHFILAMGRTAGQALLGTIQSLASMRNKWYTYNGVPLFITYHPSALLRDASLKRLAWEDLKIFRARLAMECPNYEQPNYE